MQMRSAEESRKIADLVKLEKDPTYQKNKSVLDHFARSITSAAESGDTSYNVRFEKPGYYMDSIPTIGMNEAEIFDVFCKHVAPNLREIGYIVETYVDFGYYDMLIKW